MSLRPETMSFDQYDLIVDPDPPDKRAGSLPWVRVTILERATGANLAVLLDPAAAHWLARWVTSRSAAPVSPQLPTTPVLAAMLERLVVGNDPLEDPADFERSLNEATHYAEAIPRLLTRLSGRPVIQNDPDGTAVLHATDLADAERWARGQLGPDAERGFRLRDVIAVLDWLGNVEGIDLMFANAGIRYAVDRLLMVRHGYTGTANSAPEVELVSLAPGEVIVRGDDLAHLLEAQRMGMGAASDATARLSLAAEMVR